MSVVYPLFRCSRSSAAAVTPGEGSHGRKFWTLLEKEKDCFFSVGFKINDLSLSIKHANIQAMFPSGGISMQKWAPNQEVEKMLHWDWKGNIGLKWTFDWRLC